MDALTSTAEPVHADLSTAAQSGMAVVEGRQTPAPVAEGDALFALISRAARDPSVDMDKFERLLAMQEKLEARAKEMAFNSAFADAKSEFVPIVRNATGHNDKKFADLSAISRVVDPILGKYGLSYRFRTSQAAAISVTCIVSHRGGHREENTLSGPPDKTGNKNDVQAIGSTQKYLMRYTLEGALGLATTEEDDGRAAAPKPAGFISDEQVGELQSLILEAIPDPAKIAAFTTHILKYVASPSIEEMDQQKFKKAVRGVKDEIDRQKKERAA